WGVYQGLLLILHKEYSSALVKAGIASKLLSSKVYHVASIVVTFHIVCIGWVIFRADNMQICWDVVSKLVTVPAELLHFSASQLAILQIRDPIIFPALVLLLPGLMISQVVVNWLNDKKIFQSPPWVLQVGMMVAMMCLLTIFSPDTSPRFIYFQF
ncbi:MAG TPA: hypothetical protein V6D22_11610, partial [Candidatus Obscuribacterales bacterium]